MITNDKLALIDSEALTELIYDSDLETEFFGFTDEDSPAECSTSQESGSQ